MKIQLNVKAEEFKKKLDIKDGADGHTPTKEELVSIVKPLIPEAVPGPEGKAGKTPTDAQLRTLIRPLIPAPVPGKDGSPDTGEDIIDKVNKDKSKKVIKKEKVEGLAEMEKEMNAELRSFRLRPSGGQVNSVVAGTNVTVDNTDPSNPIVSAASGGHTIEDEGTPVTDRTTLNFVGSGVAVTDVGGKTTVTIGGGGSTAWGDITGTLSNQTDLQAALDTKVENPIAIAYAVAL